MQKSSMNILQNISFCFPQKKESITDSEQWGWVNNDRIVILWANCSFKIALLSQKSGRSTKIAYAFSLYTYMIYFSVQNLFFMAPLRPWAKLPQRFLHKFVWINISSVEYLLSEDWRSLWICAVAFTVFLSIPDSLVLLKTTNNH